jgi:[ribosomal protein S5]-alanine N-acetyltransferase
MKMPDREIKPGYHPPFPHIRLNEKFHLREQAISDTESFLAYYNDPKVYEHILAEIPKTPQQAKDEIIYCRNLFYQQTGIYWAIAESENNTMIGAIGFYERDNNQLELCYDLHKNYWSKGITHLAIQKVLDYAREKMQRNQFFALTTKSNFASISVLKKNNFIFDKTLVKTRYFQGQLHDVERFILNY